jgi:protein-S-isoprenylcysteine O-methyltransferase Ste14
MPLIEQVSKRPPLIALLCLLGGLVLDSQLPGKPPIGWGFRSLGVGPASLGFWLIIQAGQAFALKGTTHKPWEKPSALVTSGPMRISRNPMYLGMALIIAGVGWLLVSTPVMLSGLVFVLIVQKYFIIPEEEALNRLFGEKYLDYRNRVRRWL